MSTYKIVEELGRGGMGVVYRALHPSLNREVAIKFLISDPGGIGDVTRSRFRREMDVLMKLSHPGIVKVYDAGEADERLYYVMELLRARDLHWHLRRRGRLPIPVALSVIDQLLDALDYIHESGVVHRDIKPSNIVLEDSGRAILMDFGVVKAAGGTLLTQEGHAVGTPRYFAPEMLTRAESSPASDQFSLGVVAYELLTACAPFEGDTLPLVAQAIMKQDPLPIEQRRTDLPAGVAPVLIRMLAKKPEERWPSAGAAREALQMAMYGPGVQVNLGETSIVPLPPGPPPSRPTAKRGVPVEPRLLVTQGSLAREAPTRRLRNGLAICAGIALAVAVPVAKLLAPARSGVTVIAGGGAWPRAAEVSVKREALDLLRVEFTTAVPARWALDRGRGLESQEAVDSVEHTLYLKTSPWQPEETLALVSGPRRVELMPPPSVSELVHRLHAAASTRELSPAAVEAVWNSIRLDLVKTVDHVTASRFRAAIEGAPATRKRFDDHVEKVRRARSLGEVLKALGPHVAAILMSAETPRALRNQLLTSLWAVDRTDALASWLALPAPFGVQRMMAPAMEVAINLTGEQPSSPRHHQLELFPDRNGVVLVLRSEVPDASNPIMKLGDTMLLMHNAVKGRKHAYEASFSNADAPQAEARRFHFELLALDPNIYLCLKPPGFDVALPLRPPDAVAASASDKVWITLTLRGAMTGVRGHWQMNQARAFEEQSRLYVIVERAIEEELPAP